MRKFFRILPVFSLIVVFIMSCSKDEPEPPEPNNLEAKSVEWSVNENPQNGFVLGTLMANTDRGDLKFSLINTSPSTAINISESGEVIVADSSVFDYEKRTLVTGLYQVTNGDSIKTQSINIAVDNMVEWYPLGNLVTRVAQGTQPIDMVIVGSEVYISYSDPDSPGIKASLVKYNSSNWETLGRELSYTKPNFIDLLLDETNHPMISYSEWLSTEDLIDATMKIKKDGSWSKVGKLNAINKDVSEIDVALYDGSIYAALNHGRHEEKHISVFKYDGTNWIAVGQELDNIMYNLTLLEFNNSLCLSFLNTDKNIVVMRLDGNEWKVVDTIHDPTTPLARFEIALHNNALYLLHSAYSKESGIKTRLSRLVSGAFEYVDNEIIVDGFAYGLDFVEDTPVAIIRASIARKYAMKKLVGGAWEPVGHEFIYPELVDRIKFGIDSENRACAAMLRDSDLKLVVLRSEPIID